MSDLKSPSFHKHAYRLVFMEGPVSPRSLEPEVQTLLDDEKISVTLSAKGNCALLEIHASGYPVLVNGVEIFEAHLLKPTDVISYDQQRAVFMAPLSALGRQLGPTEKMNRAKAIDLSVWNKNPSDPMTFAAEISQLSSPSHKRLILGCYAALVFTVAALLFPRDAAQSGPKPSETWNQAAAKSQTLEGSSRGLLLTSPVDTPELERSPAVPASQKTKPAAESLLSTRQTVTRSLKIAPPNAKDRQYFEELMLEARFDPRGAKQKMRAFAARIPPNSPLRAKIETYLSGAAM